MDVCLRFSVLCCPVYVETLRRADHPSKESYQLSNRFTSKNPSTPQGKRGRLSKKGESLTTHHALKMSPSLN
jgi:hypothetical protein